MPVYQYKDKYYNLSETDPAAAKAKIEKHLAESQQQSAAPESGVSAGDIALGVGKIGAGLGIGAAVGLPKMVWEANTASADFLAHPIESIKSIPKKAGDFFTGLSNVLPTPSEVPGQYDPEAYQKLQRLKSAGKSAGKYAVENPFATSEFVGEFLSPGAWLKGAGLVGKAAGAATKALGVGASSASSEASARALEKLGIRLEARQVRATEPGSSSGFGGKNIDRNQAIQNETMGKDTGRLAKDGQQLTRSFIDERKSVLGDRYKKIYTKDKFFAFPQNVIDELASFYQKEASLGPAGASVPKRTAGNVLQEFEQSSKAPGSLQINGEGLQRVRTDLLEVARSTTSAADKNMAYKLVGLLDDTVESNYPGLKKVMGNLNQQYRATIALDELERYGAIRNGDLSGSKAGAFFRTHENVGTKAQREFAHHAENTNLQARWQTSASADVEMRSSVWKTAMNTINVVPRTQAARSIQRRMATRMQGKTPATMTTAEDAQNAADIEAFAKANAQPIDYTKGKKPTPSNQNPLPPPPPFDASGGFF